MAKSKLSKHLLEMKFMQRTAVRIQKEESQEEQQKQIDDEHWVLDIPTLSEEESRYIFEPSYVNCEELAFGRFSYKGFNPDIERLTKVLNNEEELARSEAKEQESMVNDEEMAERYDSLVGTIGKKFKRKRNREENQEDEESGDLISGKIDEDTETRTYRLLNQLREMKEKKIFLKPLDS